MARKEPEVRRNEILDAAQYLIYTKGYEQMTIQDILDKLQVSKGGFYHHFDSKHQLLEALVERMMDESEQVFLPIVQDPNASALAKLQRMFDEIGRWKTDQKTYLLALLRVWYADENALIRWKVREYRRKRIGPLFAAIIDQGIKDGTLITMHPNPLSDVVLSLLQDFVDTLATLFLSIETSQNNLNGMLNLVSTYTISLEHVLGVPAGSLSLVDVSTLEEWVHSFADMNVQANPIQNTEGKIS